MKRRACLAASLTVATRLALPGSMAALAGCGTSRSTDTPTRFSGPTMGTAYRLSVSERLSPDETKALRADVEAVLRRVDTLMSTYRPESELSRFNALGAGESVRVASDTAAVLAEAVRIASVSHGAFDTTVGPLVDLWGFGPREGTGVPSDEAIADASAATGPGAFRFDASEAAMTKHLDGLRIDLSGVAKGYAVDLVAARLDGLGLDGYLIDIGGELRARGRKADGTAWQVGIERPVANQRRVQRVVGMESGAVATSGDYRNFFEHDGRRYSHMIDPRTGHPVGHTLTSVSVVAPRAATADALSTAMMVLGPDEGLELAERLDVPALFLLRDAKSIVERATRGFTELTVA